MPNQDCIHNQRCRYTHGFYCEDCETFFDKDSSTYRSGELLSSIWMTLHNINVALVRSGKDANAVITAMRDKIGIDIEHDNYEELITEAEFVMARHGVNSESCAVVLDRA